MQLSRLSDPVDTWEYAERFLGGGTRRYSRFSADLDVADAFHPQRGPQSFDVETFVVPAGPGTFHRTGADDSPARWYDLGGHFLLPVHPQILAAGELAGRDELLRCARGPTLTVTPTANVRTVLVRRVGAEPVPPHFVKLHFPRRLSRFTRRLRPPIIELELWVADQLRRAGVPFLDEVAGGYLGSDPQQAWGFLVREAPIGLLTGGAHVVPVFALYGTDLRRPDDPPLIAQLIARDGAGPERYLCDRVIDPMVRLWCRTYRETGCVPETHGQNTLFAVDPVTGWTTIRYRDCGIYVDAALRSRRRLPGLPPTNVLARDVAAVPEQVLSLAYDSFMGHHVFAALADVALHRWGVGADALRAAARRAFDDELAGDSPLPKTVFYYDDVLRADGGWSLVDTGRPPDWR